MSTVAVLIVISVTCSVTVCNRFAPYSSTPPPPPLQVPAAVALEVGALGAAVGDVTPVSYSPSIPSIFDEPQLAQPKVTPSALAENFRWPPGSADKHLMPHVRRGTRWRGWRRAPRGSRSETRACSSPSSAFRAAKRWSISLNVRQGLSSAGDCGSSPGSSAIRARRGSPRSRFRRGTSARRSSVARRFAFVSAFITWHWRGLRPLILQGTPLNRLCRCAARQS